MANKKRGSVLREETEKSERNNKNKLFSLRSNLNLLHHLILVVVPLMLYAQTFRFNLSYLDDNIILVDQSAPLKNFDLHKIFFSDAWLMNKAIELYRPLQSLSYAVDFVFSKTSIGVFHIHNVIIFCLGIQLLYFFLMRLTIPPVHSFWLSLLFSVHFLLAHTVCWIPARGDLYLFAFSIACLLSWHQYFKKRKIIYLIFSSLLYFGALLSKESAIVLIPLIILTGFLFWNFNLKEIKFYILFLPSVVLTIVYFWMRSQSIHPSASIFEFSSLIYNLPVIPEEVCKIFVPLFFSVMPAFSSTVTIAGVTVIAILMTVIFLFRKKINNRMVLLGVAIFLIPLIPVLIYKPTFSRNAYDYLDHRMIFSGAGLLLIVYALCASLFEKKYSGTFLFLILITMSFITYSNEGNYKNYKTYFDNATATNPKSVYAWEQYGICLARENKNDEAIEKFKQASRLNPSNSEVRIELATTYYDQKDYSNMMKECGELILLAPENPKSYCLIAFYYSNQNKNDSALKYMSVALTKDSTNAETYFYLGMIYNKMKYTESALADFTKAVTLNPSDPRAYYERGNIYGKTGKMKEAIKDFDLYIKLIPTDGNGYFYRGQAYYMDGDKEKGCQDFHTSALLGNEKAVAKINQLCN